MFRPPLFVFIVTLSKTSSTLSCETYQLNKHCRFVYPSSDTRSLLPFSIVDSDVGDQPQLPLYLCFITLLLLWMIISGVTWVYLLKSKGDVFMAFKSFNKLIWPQFDTKFIFSS